MISFLLRRLKIQIQEWFGNFNYWNTRFSVLFIFPLESFWADIGSNAISNFSIWTIFDEYKIVSANWTLMRTSNTFNDDKIFSYFRLFCLIVKLET